MPPFVNTAALLANDGVAPVSAQAVTPILTAAAENETVMSPVAPVGTLALAHVTAERLPPVSFKWFWWMVAFTPLIVMPVMDAVTPPARQLKATAIVLLADTAPSDKPGNV